jgi:hypothetical protein
MQLPPVEQQADVSGRFEPPADGLENLRDSIVLD